MSESVETTLEEASRCPKCQNPGRYEGERVLESIRNAKTKIFGCHNERCKWYGQTWVVQVNANGTIPPATLRRPKQFAPLPGDGEKFVENLQRQIDLETGKGGEITKRY